MREKWGSTCKQKIEMLWQDGGDDKKLAYLGCRLKLESNVEWSGVEWSRQDGGVEWSEVESTTRVGCTLNCLC